MENFEKVSNVQGMQKWSKFQESWNFGRIRTSWPGECSKQNKTKQFISCKKMFHNFKYLVRIGKLIYMKAASGKGFNESLQSIFLVK